MKLPKCLIVMILSINYVSYANAATRLKLTESKLIELSKQRNSVQIRNEAKLANLALSAAKLDSKYGWSSIASARRSDTRQKSAMPFQPAIGPVDSLAFGIEKNMPLGLTSRLQVFSEQTSLKDNSITRATTTGLKLQVDADLWKNFAGRLDRLQKHGIELGKENTVLSNTLDATAFTYQIRKLYWSFVAIEEQFKISTALLNNASRQLQQAKKRYDSSVGDEAQMLRFESQVATRQASITSLDYQRETLKLQLKTLLPQLANKEISLGAYNLGSTIQKVLQCTRKIASQTQTPWHNTQYDELIKGLQKQIGVETKFSEQYDQADLKLSGEFNHTGIDNNYADAIGQSGAQGKPSYAVMLALRVPLGSATSSWVSMEKKSKTANLEAQVVDMKARVEAHHTQITPVIKLLNRSVKEQDLSSKLLANTLKATEKKFSQARADLEDVINDQNALAASQFDTIRTKLTVIHTLYDYLQVFSQTQCSIHLSASL